MKKLIMVALLLSIITGFAVYQYATTLEKKSTVNGVSVVVSVIMIPKNTMITEEMVIVKQVPQNIVNELSVKSFDELKGLITKENIYPNEQILLAKLDSGGEKGSELSFSIKKDYRALTIKTDEISGIAGYINKGDHVDIASVLIDKSKAQGIISKMIAENIEVVEVGIKPISNEDQNKSQYTSITVLIPAADILKINYALSEGKYSILLRSVLDENITNIPEYIP